MPVRRGLAQWFHYRSFGRIASAVCATVLVLSLSSSSGRPRATASRVAVKLPAWASLQAVSTVFAVSGVPETECTLRGGRLGGPSPCDLPAHALRDEGVDALLAEMRAHGAPLESFIGGEDVVVVSVESRCAAGGTGSGRGRLATSTDVVKGIVWRILQRPGGFCGEVVVAGERPDTPAGFAATPANAADRAQSLEDVVAAFSRLGYPVSLVDWGRVGSRPTRAPLPPDKERGEGGGGQGDRTFRTQWGNLFSLERGVWRGGRYDPARLRLINVAVLTADGAWGATGAWANLAGPSARAAPTPEALGTWLARVRAPDLNLLDATWVADDSCAGTAVRRDVLLASSDPFALDWYASEVVLYPAVAYWQDASAARAGTFRDVTRAAQRAAAVSWWGEHFPWIVLGDADGDAPSQEERDQLDVFVVGDTGVLFADGFESGTCELWSEVAQ